MNRWIRLFRLFPLLGALAGPVLAQDATFVEEKALTWQSAPPTLPKGASVAVLHGDPGKDGPFTIRLRTPAGYMVPPHYHSRAESLTVLRGALHIGMGDTFDRKSAHALAAGGFHQLPARAHHYAFSDRASEIQISGEGPFDIVYLNPADDPSQKQGK
jgi:hypothetical protein